MVQHDVVNTLIGIDVGDLTRTHLNPLDNNIPIELAVRGHARSSGKA